MTQTTTSESATPQQRGRQAQPLRPPLPAPSPLSGRFLAGLVAANLAVIVSIFVAHGGVGQLGASGGGWARSAGQLGGLFGAFAIVVQLVLISRVPWLERRLGMDTLNRWHRWNGFAATWLLVVHAVLSTLGLAWKAGLSLPAMVTELVLEWPNVLAAMVALALIVGVAVTSMRAARRALAYETWWFVHCYAYLAVILAFSHQLAVGTDFVDDRLARAYWVALYLSAGVLLVGYRWLQPAFRAYRHRLVVDEVVHETADVASIVLAGRDLHRLPSAPGQFFLLRFMRRDRWWKAHPISLSAAPDGQTLRFTIKALGEDTEQVRAIPPGTRVMAEGPYGAFTAAKATRRKIALIGGGIGITPIRALYEGLDRAPGEVTLLYRARNRDEAVFHDELAALSDRRGFGLAVSYSRPFGRPAGGNPFSPKALRSVIPDVEERDCFVCGPTPLIAAAVNGLRQAGVPANQIHAERFDY